MTEHRVGGHGLHVSLQVKAFGKFMDTVDSEREIESLYYEVAGRMSQRMSKYFATEGKREEEFLTEMMQLSVPTVHFKKVPETHARSDTTVEVAVDNKMF